MSDIAFKNGFLCGLIGTGLSIGGSTGGANVKLPSPKDLVIVSLNGYNNVATYLKISSYTTVVSSGFNDMPSGGYIVIGGFDLYDFEGDDWWSTPEADLKIVIDGEVVFEGDSWTFFDYEMSLNPPKTFQYKTSFEIAARRRNMSDGMQILLKETMIVGLK